MPAPFFALSSTLSALLAAYIGLLATSFVGAAVALSVAGLNAFAAILTGAAAWETRKDARLRRKARRRVHRRRRRAQPAPVRGPAVPTEPDQQQLGEE